MSISIQEVSPFCIWNCHRWHLWSCGHWRNRQEPTEAIKEAGIDTFLTGEGPHWSYTAAEEVKLNVLYGGHYLTETFGVRAVMDLLEGEFGIDGCFIDHPTGM